MGQWLLIMLLVLGVALDKGMIAIPDRWLPWTPISIETPPGPFLGWKLARLADDPEACRAVLAADPPQRYTPLDDVTRGQCELSNLVRYAGGQSRLQPSVMTRCPLAVAWAVFERHELSAAARAHLGVDVAQIEHFGSFACRNIYGRAEGRRSQHASAEALDVAAFELEDGRRVSLSGHWGKGAEGRFLKEVGQRACKVFGTVLGPDYNAAHADHFHLGVGGRVCR
ncbi:extensin family protein [Halomonas sp. DP1Y21-3]|uniref:extensin-like domain-containing protein n=1 Tax=Halomonas sp. DP1Y21-3 TaxID=2859080 RepID=UPI001C94E34E|nr:extensin family protein [Halomonas sp. DP1Y21-3]MBY6110444.1 extensin family protein [Halomonas sp. DP1Y21-3]